MFRNLWLLVSQWFSGSSGLEEKRLSIRERLLAFLLLLILFYGAVWLLFQLFAPAYREGLAKGVSGVYLAQGKPLEFATVGSKLLFECRNHPAFEANLSTEGIDANMAFLLTLLLVTPGMRNSNRVFRLISAFLLLYASHVVFVMVKVEITLIAAKHPLAGTPWLWNGLDNFFEITGRVFFPIFIWLLLGLPYMLGAVDQPVVQTQKKVKRNDPCPCGSGRKYKFCCGH
jgi:hypothetical protein